MAGGVCNRDYHLDHPPPRHGHLQHHQDQGQGECRTPWPVTASTLLQLHSDTVFFFIILLISVNIKYLLTINIMSMPSLLSYLPVLSPPFPQGWILRIYPPLHGAMVSALSYLPLLSPPFPPSCSVEPSACTRHVTRAQGGIFSPEYTFYPSRT